MLYLTDPDCTLHILAQRYDRSEATIGRYLSGPDYDQMRETIQGTMALQAKDILARGAEKAAAKWAGQTIDVAAGKGDHRPMRDLLTSVGAIRTTAEDTPPQMIVLGVNLQDCTVNILPPAPQPTVKSLTPAPIDLDKIPVTP
jgi:hypothetical protein